VQEGEMDNRVMWQVNRERHGELLDVAEATRLCRGARVEMPRRKEQVLVSVGEVLVTAGQWLKARYEPATQQGGFGLRFD
jgi:hypothetical protein